MADNYSVTECGAAEDDLILYKVRLGDKEYYSSAENEEEALNNVLGVLSIAFS